ncbi:hypothetical protein FDECE_11546 [Fusarium decemcellulare]|nr:hypothetical protein FDECE_11546 [Fusarium decemcellulare]
MLLAPPISPVFSPDPLALQNPASAPSVCSPSSYTPRAQRRRRRARQPSSSSGHAPEPEPERESAAPSQSTRPRERKVDEPAIPGPRRRFSNSASISTSDPGPHAFGTTIGNGPSVEILSVAL